MSGAAGIASQDKTPARKARSTIVDDVVAQLTSRIFSGHYAPGQRLIEIDLTRQLGVGRNALREALGRLSGEGLIQIEPYRGAIVTRPSRKEVLDLLEVRECLEIKAALSAVERIDEARIRRRALDEIGPLLAPRETQPLAEEYLVENQRFHGAILAIAGNHCLPRLLDQLQLPVFQIAFFQKYDHQLYQESARDHADIFQAILDRDAGATEAAVRRHVRRSMSLVESLPSALFRPEET